MVEKVGVFICDCGTNISESIETAELAKFAEKHDDVVEVKIHRLWCSDKGKEELKRIIMEKKLSRVVMAACSPKQHELTFQKVLISAGLNPYLLQMVNLREQVAWVTKDKAAALKKAVSQLNSALKRVRLHKPLEKKEIECKTDLLVIGAGIAGMSAALTAAQKNRKVYLVEKQPWIGGKVAAYEDVFPNLDCAPCMLEPKEDDVLHHQQITLLTNSEVENVKGFFGNFEVEVKNKARFIDADKCLGCGDCFEVCPVKVKNKFDGNLSERRAVYTAFAGALPNLPIIDRENCLRFKGEDCRKCQAACPCGAVDYEQKDKTVSVQVGALVVATGFELMDVSRLKNFSPHLPNVVNGYQFERLTSSTGPTGGKILTAGNQPPNSIAFIHCAGSRDKNYRDYCSGVCCAYSLKLAHLARKKLGNIKTYEIYSDWCLPGKGYQEFYNKFASEGTCYLRVNNPNEIKIGASGKGLLVNYGGGSLTVDMVVLAPAIVPSSGVEDLAILLGLARDKNGFYLAEHEKISPASTTNRGIYIAGCAAGPKDIAQSVLQAQAGAGMVLNILVPGEKLELEAAVSTIDEKRCGACLVCVPLCPYQAISFDAERKTAVINDVLCRGCGVCAASCPSGAAENKHFTAQQIFAEIEGVME